MDLTEIFNQMPFTKALGIEIVSIEDGEATGKLELTEKHSSNPNRLIAHGGVTYALADTVGGAAAISANETVTPTIDMRIDYLAPATGGVLHAEAEVVRNGNSVAAVTVEITDEDGREIAAARGVYKSGGGGGDSAWVDGELIA